MNRSTRITSVVCVLVSAVLAAGGPASAQFSADDAKCRATVAKAGGKLAKTILKSFASCHKARNADESLVGTDCNDAATADLSEKLPAAITKFTSSVTGACPTQSPSSLLYETCPFPCAETVPALTDFGDVAECLACVATSQLEAFSLRAFSEPDPTLEKEVAACHKSITGIGSKLVTSIVKSVSKCQSQAEKNGETSITDCTQTSYDSLVADALENATTALETKNCSALALPNTRLDACDLPSTVAELASCVVATADADAQFLASALLALPEGLVSTTTTSTTMPTTTTLPPADPDCPAFVDIEIYSRDTHEACTSNGDCTAPRTCDTVGGTCSSPTKTDFGWSGLGHDLDSNTGSRVRLDLNCEGPAAPGCGTCTVTGVNPEPGNCRCANDIRTVCDDPFSTAAECGGSECRCYLGTPTPVSSGGAPFCMIQRLAADITGSVDVDSGASELSASLRTQVNLGLAVAAPCPTCGGTCTDNPAQLCVRDADCVAGTCTLDPVAGDGVRGGTCTSGTTSTGLSCDVAATNASYPAFPAADGGSGYSLDCMTDAGYNVSGHGLAITLEQGTGASSLAANVSCGGVLSGEDCTCLVCSNEPSIPCNDHSDCAGQQGKCSLATGSNPARCDANADCLARDAGACHPGILRCINATSVMCNANADCDSVHLGTCTPSTCSEDGSAGFVAPNGCDGFLCTDLGGGEGECTDGPDVRFCDNVVQANGGGIFACSTNDDCAPGVVGVDAGDCTIEKRSECYPDPVSASGSAHPLHPVTAATYCAPPTVSAGVNAASGLPGPVRTVQQTSITSYCASDPGVVYTPGGGSCP
jgi:hypothetical protein